MKYLMQMSLVYLINIYRVKLSTCQQKNVFRVKKVKLTDMTAAIATGEKLSMFVIVKSKKKISGIEINKKLA